MSCTTRKTVWEKIDVVVGEDLQDSLLEIISKGEKCLEQKFSKLNLLLKNMNVYYCKEHVVVNDRYGACADFKEIAQAFGFKTIETKLSLRGKNYLLTDEIIKILCQLDEKFSLEKYGEQKGTEEMIEAIKKLPLDSYINGGLLDNLRKIVLDGKITLQGEQEVTTAYYGKRVYSRKEGEIRSSKDKVYEQLENYILKSAEKLGECNEQMQNGTVKLLYSRARQMGYSVKEEKKGNEVQLVLGRVD